MKRLPLSIISLALCLTVYGQSAKKTPSFGHTTVDFSSKKLVKPIETGNLQPVTHASPNIHAPGPESFQNLSRAAHGVTVVEYNDDGMPKALEQKSLIMPRDRDRASFLAGYLASSLGLDTGGAYEVTGEESDERGANHYRFQQTYRGLPVINGEYTVHLYADQSMYARGYVWKPEVANTLPAITATEAASSVKKYLSERGIQYADQQIGPLISTGIKTNRLCIYRKAGNNEWVAAYQLKVVPNLKENWEAFVDAVTGSVIDAHSNICRMSAETCDHIESATAPSGAETASAVDLFNVSRTINVWKEGSTYFMIDASRPMFQASRSRFPNSPFGVIQTYDFKNRNIENTNTADFISSSNNSWSSKTSVSAHLNAAAAYEYFRQTHGRNSIDGTGGNITSVINVQDGGGAMDNAFWNGEAMFYGNGNRAFTPLAKGIDVAGHEMSHGVIGSTANLAYEDESGAINESYADIFGAMIDRDDWKIGEDVVITSVFRSGALRDLSNPHNGGSSLNDIGFQPRQVSEQFTGTEDNGGVHINSGIPNFAFFNFVTEMAKNRSLEDARKNAEKVYYYALTKLLTRSSNFKDLRAAIERSCSDLFGSTPDVLASAKTAFDKVGIGSPGGGVTPGNRVLQTNPGKEFMVCTDANQNGVYMFDFASNPTVLSSRSIISKPSVTDDGNEIYFVGSDKKLYGLFFNAVTKKYEESLLDNDPVYRNAVISKDGRLLAAVADVPDHTIYVFDFNPAVQAWKSFLLYNPSFSNTVTGDVQYADVMDFSHSGEYVMYDASNVIKRSSGEDYEYWDIGFLRVFNNSTRSFGDGKIEKLVSSLPDGVTIGNPVFSKNSLDVIAFDYVEDGATAYLLGSNIETNDFQAILSDRPVLSYPNFSNKDNVIVFDGQDNSLQFTVNSIGLATSKIQASGSEKTVLTGARWGTWFANGVRKLTVDTKEPDAGYGVVVQPNPCGDFLNVTIAGSREGNIRLRIFDSFGRLVMSQTTQASSGLLSMQLETGAFEAGTYLLQATGPGGSRTVTFIKGY